MSNYYGKLRWISDPVMRKRCAERLITMRATLAELRSSRRDNSILLATWNLRDFGADGRFGSKGRLEESYYYIAEIIDCFDLVALQEVNENLAAFNRLMDILGDHDWDYIMTDVANAEGGGNGERMAFLYNRDKVTFTRTAGEIVLPNGQLIVPRAAAKPPAVAGATAGNDVPALSTAAPDQMRGQQFARTPYVVSFQAGWFKINLCTVHIYYGKTEAGEELNRRIDEIKALVHFFAKRHDAESKGKPTPRDAPNYILLGDFNVVSPEHETMQALTSEGFTVPAAIDGAHLTDRDHFYDQIAVRVKDPRFKVLRGGIVDIYADVFRPEDLPLYADLAVDTTKKTKPDKQYEKWKTWQLSDHKPLWVEIQTDYTDDYLGEIAALP